MKRYDACILLTEIAQNSLIDFTISKDLISARDAVICSPNKILDTLADEKKRTMLIDFIVYVSDSLKAWECVNKDIVELYRELLDSLRFGFDDPCDKVYITERCKNCPNYKGEEK